MQAALVRPDAVVAAFNHRYIRAELNRRRGHKHKQQPITSGHDGKKHLGPCPDGGGGGTLSTVTEEVRPAHVMDPRIANADGQVEVLEEGARFRGHHGDD